MKLAALILLFAIVGKISAVPLRLAYYRAGPQRAVEEEESDEELEDEISGEDFSQNHIQDDDDDSDEQELPPQFHKLFPLPQANQPGHNMPLSVMMSEISDQGWNVPKKSNHIPKQEDEPRARDELDVNYDDDDDDDSDEDDDDEEDDEPEDDLPDWEKMFPNVESQGNGPPAGVVDTSGAPEIPASFRSSIGNSRVVYIPARQFRQQMRVRPTISSAPRQQQYMMRAPVRSQYMHYAQQYAQPQPISYMPRRQQVMIHGRPQQHQQVILASSASSRRPQQAVYYMPVRRGSYSPYTSAYVPRYRY